MPPWTSAGRSSPSCVPEAVQDFRIEVDEHGGSTVVVDGYPQSYVSLADPELLVFGYVQHLGAVIDSLPDGPVAVTHVGGAAMTLPRYVQATRPGSPQIVLEPDVEVTAVVRAKLPLPPRSRIRVREVGGRDGVAALRDASADVVVLDAFSGGRVPHELTTLEFITDVTRVLRPSGVFIANVADGRPLGYSHRLAATVRKLLPQVLVSTDVAVGKGKRFGNVVVVGARTGLPVAEVRRAAAAAPFPRSVLLGFGRDARPLRDDDPQRSPEPPEEMWRMGHWQDA